MKKNNEAFELKKIVGNPRQSGELSETLCYLDSEDMKITQVLQQKTKGGSFFFFLYAFLFRCLMGCMGPKLDTISHRDCSLHLPVSSFTFLFFFYPSFYFPILNLFFLFLGLKFYNFYPLPAYNLFILFYVHVLILTFSS